MGIPSKVRERMASGLKRLVPIIEQQRTRDVSEADTVTLVKDLLSEVFGYDKYAELTSEHAIRSTFCDLAVKLSDKLVELIEVKAVGTALEDRHVRQVIDYAANQGVEWVVLTNAAVWRLYQVLFAKPIDKRLLLEIDLTTLDPKKEDQLECAYLFTKEGFGKGAHIELRDRLFGSRRLQGERSATPMEVGDGLVISSNASAPQIRDWASNCSWNWVSLRASSKSRPAQGSWLCFQSKPGRLLTAPADTGPLLTAKPALRGLTPGLPRLRRHHSVVV